ncbi:Uncharacterised protein [Gordonia paraffinivorans]|uniref:Transposase and inactivated derivatives n=1 Tax=Gordonia paraffinivorans TaxID=175628 RepID=A0ABD7V7B1_9ACTN|nr:Uncharacterised protein [Gordonia paraffinivorans]
MWCWSVIIRDGARQMLAAALQAEVAAYVAMFADQRDKKGHRLVVRIVYHHPREVLTTTGAVEVKAPRVNDRRVDPDAGHANGTSSLVEDRVMSGSRKYPAELRQRLCGWSPRYVASIRQSGQRSSRLPAAQGS